MDEVVKGDHEEHPDQRSVMILFQCLWADRQLVGSRLVLPRMPKRRTKILSATSREFWVVMLMSQMHLMVLEWMPLFFVEDELREDPVQRAADESQRLPDLGEHRRADLLFLHKRG